MARVFSYLKKSALLVLAVLVLLVVQAMCDLELPSYISNIVNVGIQQGGIPDGTPREIRASEFDKLMLFMSPDGQQTVLSFYEQAGDIFKLRNADREDLETLSSLFSHPMLIVWGIESNSEIFMGKMKENFPVLPPGTDLFSVLSKLPREQIEALLAKTRESLQSFGDAAESMIRQAGAAYIRSEYIALGKDMTAFQSRYILLAGLKMLGFSLIIIMAAVLTTLLSARISASLGRDLRSGVFRKVVGFTSQELDAFSSASLITRCTNDIQQIQMLVVMSLRMVIYAPILGVGALLKVLAMKSGMAWIIGLGIGIIMAVILVLINVAMPKFKAMQKLMDKLNLIAREILNGLPVIRAFSREEHEEYRFDRSNMDLIKNQLFVNRVMVIMFPVMMLIMNSLSVLIIWVGAGSADAGTIQVGTLMAFIQYTMQIVMAFMMLSMMSVMLPRSIVSASRVAEVLDSKGEIQDPEVPLSYSLGLRGMVEFQDVCFRYPHAEADVLSHISFTARPGETTAVIGATGSGKTTLINLIPRFYDVTRGRILVGGTDVRDLTLRDLREKIGYVPQKGQLFTGTLASNIGYGPSSPDPEQIRRAAKIAQAADFIDEKTEKYESSVSQGGTNVSGGQRQRISIARAIVKAPDIYIFDDSFSALDYQTDLALRKALKEATSDSTILVVAQRISTVLNADQILVLEEGQIAGKGTHDELMESCEIYRQIALSQLSEKELGA